MPPRSYIEAMDRPTVLYILYTMVSAQQTNLLPKNALRNDAIFAQKVYQIYAFLCLLLPYPPTPKCTPTMSLMCEGMKTGRKLVISWDILPEN